MNWYYVKAGEMYLAPCTGGFIRREAEHDGVMVAGVGLIAAADLEKAIRGHVQAQETRADLDPPRRLAAHPCCGGFFTHSDNCPL